MTRYLNTDLELASNEDLAELAELFSARGLFALHVGAIESGVWRAAFETEEQHVDSESTIEALLDVIEGLEPEHRAVWNRCTRRELDVGYDCGNGPEVFSQTLSGALLARVARVGASLRITLYPE